LSITTLRSGAQEGVGDILRDHRPFACNHPPEHLARLLGRQRTRGDLLGGQQQVLHGPAARRIEPRQPATAAKLRQMAGQPFRAHRRVLQPAPEERSHLAKGRKLAEDLVFEREAREALCPPLELLDGSAALRFGHLGPGEREHLLHRLRPGRLGCLGQDRQLLGVVHGAAHHGDDPVDGRVQGEGAFLDLLPQRLQLRLLIEPVDPRWAAQLEQLGPRPIPVCCGEPQPQRAHLGAIEGRLLELRAGVAGRGVFPQQRHPPGPQPCETGAGMGVGEGLLGKAKRPDPPLQFRP
jgi:hypothetical protein